MADIESVVGPVRRIRRGNSRDPPLNTMELAEMFASRRRLFLLSALLVSGAACNNGQNATDVQMSRMDDARATFTARTSNMVDNAILRDMSVADIHFIPHTAELSGVGEARLNRMARLLHTYGGTVRYETLASDDSLVNRRLAHVREYLALTGCNMERVEITTGMAGGRGMPGDEGVEKFIRGTEKPVEQGTAGGSLLSGLQSSQ